MATTEFGQFFTFVLTNIADFLMMEPISYIVGLIILSIVISLFLRFVRWS